MHMYFILFAVLQAQRNNLIRFLKDNGVQAVFHYLSLHQSYFYKEKHQEGRELPESDRYSDTLVRLPLYYELEEIDQVIETIKNFDPNYISKIIAIGY